MNLITYPDRQALVLALAQQLGQELAQHLRTNERISFCVPGGTSPAPVFDALSALDLDWSRVTVLLGDERWVAEDHPRSNAALLRRHLLRSKAAAARLLPLYTGAATPDEAAPGLSELVDTLLPLNVSLLGMGEDMHTASLFPGAEGLAEALAADAPAVLPIHGGGATEPRISLTARVLASTLNGHLLIYGAAKRKALERAASLPPEQAPIRAVMRDLTVHWAE
ncbi:MAG: 6-phosphogluconolactonase [Paracoccus sp. (in: a-proteobacteria)]|uniref:6-phosphogluconolactonase n=1 Tax=Paracoccus sp. TaxID=267 RepID=UPI0026DFC194|nr:6-phosphogluconolactonase [Paracoccus sp. (in: a-proteobacteria)]MDO5621597.1 6-phosphogluconolactonase [Paracoccus sp. (in: a-proteobacteria)]